MLFENYYTVKRETGRDKFNTPTTINVEVNAEIRNIENKNNDTIKLTIYSADKIKNEDEIFYNDKWYRINKIIDNSQHELLGHWKGELQ